MKYIDFTIYYRAFVEIVKYEGKYIAKTYVNTGYSKEFIRGFGNTEEESIKDLKKNIYTAYPHSDNEKLKEEK